MSLTRRSALLGALMGFSNPIIGGAAALIRAAIKSPNYVPHTSGWTINKDGSAEFTNVTARGTVEVDASSGPGKVVIDGTGITIYNSAGTIVLQVDDTAGSLAILNALSIATDTVDFPSFEPSGPGFPALRINTAAASGGTGPGTTFMNVNGTLAVIDTTSGNNFPDFCIGQSVVSPRADEFLVVPMGVVGNIKRSAAASAGVTIGVESKDANLGDTQFIAQAGRSYTIRYRGRARSTAANTTIDIRIRANNSGVSPTTASTQFDSSHSIPILIAGGGGGTTFNCDVTVQCPTDIAAGLWTVAGFYACTAGAGTASVDSGRSLIPMDIGTGV